MYTAKLSWENGNKETKEFAEYDEMVAYLGENADAGFMAWDDGEQMNEADISRDVDAYINR